MNIGEEKERGGARATWLTGLGGQPPLITFNTKAWQERKRGKTLGNRSEGLTGLGRLLGGTTAALGCHACHCESM